jgi:hypothetical protein
MAKQWRVWRNLNGVPTCIFCLLLCYYGGFIINLEINTQCCALGICVIAFTYMLDYAPMLRFLVYARSFIPE